MATRPDINNKTVLFQANEDMQKWRTMFLSQSPSAEGAWNPGLVSLYIYVYCIYTLVNIYVETWTSVRLASRIIRP